MKLGTNSWIQSIAIHLIFIAALVIAMWQPVSRPEPKRTLVKMKVVEKESPPVVKKPPKVQPIEIKKQAAPPKKSPPKKPPRKVFGATKKSIISKESSVSVKAGNTVAVEPKGLKLRPEDEAPLPIPAEEYLVTEMPELESEVVVNYPAEAREQGIEGVVVMQILIDESGKVRKADLLDGPGFGLNEAALEAILRFRFRPARIEDQPVAVQIRYAYRFVLE